MKLLEEIAYHFGIINYDQVVLKDKFALFYKARNKYILVEMESPIITEENKQIKCTMLDGDAQPQGTFYVPILGDAVEICRSIMKNESWPP